jgi:hypothetical protein
MEILVNLAHAQTNFPAAYLYSLSKVHQISRAHGVWVVISLISKYGCLPGVKEAKILKKNM